MNLIAHQHIVDKRAPSLVYMYMYKIYILLYSNIISYKYKSEKRFYFSSVPTAKGTL